ncbi:Pheromone B beta 1 receptor [Leucoagaricus sp. SymC.cos]|nr:Pheromone B beta 1 receptor [Leucoagaricus sp. SymC.cos]
MSSAPAAVSFICSAILAFLIAARRVRVNVAKLALVVWLLGCNMVHGINASIWSSNVDLKALGWCDLVTKLVLATTIAVPAACLCISRYLEMISSSRNLPSGAKAFRNRRIFDAILCYLIPFLYMPLHIISQDFRFDLMKGIGCMASVHPSSAGSAVVWLPPIVMCVLSLLLSGMAVRNSLCHPSTHFSTHLESRSTMNSGIWSRTLSISMTLTAATLLVLIFTMFSLSTSDPWISWQHVHQHLGEVHIVGETDQVAGGIKTLWWGLRVITLCYIILVLVLGEESRDIFKYLAGVKKPSFNFITSCRRRRNREDKVFPNPPSFDKPPRPLTLGLRSGWDDDLDIKSPGLFRLSPKGWKKGGRSSPPMSPSPAPSSKTIDDGYVATSVPYLSFTVSSMIWRIVYLL